MPICGRLGSKLAPLVMSLVSGLVSLSIVVLLDMFANEASDGITNATKRSSFVSRNIQYLGIPPVVVVLWVAVEKIGRHLQAGGTDGVDQNPRVESQLEDQLNPDDSPLLHSTGSSVTVMEHEVEMPNRICFNRLVPVLLGQVTGLAYLSIRVLLAMFANQASHGLSEATRGKTVLRNIQFLLIPCLLVGLCGLRYRIRARAKEHCQAEESAADQFLQSQASPDGEGQTPVVFDQASLTSKPWWKCTRSFGFLRQLWRNIRKLNPGHPHSELEGVSPRIKAGTQSEADGKTIQQGQVQDVSFSMRATPLLQADETMEDSSGTSQPDEEVPPAKILEMEFTVSRQLQLRRRKKENRKRKKGNVGVLRNLGLVDEQLGLDQDDNSW